MHSSTASSKKENDMADMLFLIIDALTLLIEWTLR